MSEQRSTPPLDAATIKYMENLFPERCPHPSDTEREIWMKAGERRAVNKLKALLLAQEEEGIF